jgi:hypothetical protein
MSLAVTATTLRPVPKPTSLRIGQHAARALARSQGHLFDDLAADHEAAQASDVADLIDARRDEHIRNALRLVRLARRDRANMDGYLALADGHLREAIRTDRIHDEHRRRGRRQIGASIEAGKAGVAVIDALLTGRSS